MLIMVLDLGLTAFAALISNIVLHPNSMALSVWLVFLAMSVKAPLLPGLYITH